MPFLKKGPFTVTITIGKGELPELYKELPGMLPKTRELWENRYPCGDGGWVRYRVESGVELSDFQNLLSLKIRPARKT